MPSAFGRLFRKRNSDRYTYSTKNEFFVQVWLPDNETVHEFTLTNEQTANECCEAVARKVGLAHEDYALFGLYIKLQISLPESNNYSTKEVNKTSNSSQSSRSSNNAKETAFNDATSNNSNNKSNSSNTASISAEKSPQLGESEIPSGKNNTNKNNSTAFTDEQTELLNKLFGLKRRFWLDPRKSFKKQYDKIIEYTYRALANAEGTSQNSSSQKSDTNSKNSEKYKVKSSPSPLTLPQNLSIVTTVNFGTLNYNSHPLYKSEAAKWFLYLQIRNEFLEGTIDISDTTVLAEVISYIMQAEFQEFDAATHTYDFFKSYVICPEKHITKLESLVNHAISLYGSRCSIQQSMESGIGGHHMSSSLDAIEAERRVIQLISDYSESGFGEEIFYTNYGDGFTLTMSFIRVGDLTVKLFKTEKSEKLGKGNEKSEDLKLSPSGVNLAVTSQLTSNFHDKFIVQYIILLVNLMKENSKMIEFLERIWEETDFERNDEPVS